MSALEKHSKRISFWLRHQPSDAGLVPDPFGWVNLDDLLAALAKLGIAATDADLIACDLAADKRRWQVDSPNRRVRATHGHSFSVMQDREPATPPTILYHGTAERSLAAILRDGIQPMQRQFVHLAATPEAALKVGSRHGKPVLLTVHTEALVAAGQLFYNTSEGVWLTSSIAPNAIETATN